MVCCYDTSHAKKRAAEIKINMQYNTAFTSFSVPDLQKAKQFYGETLGLTVTERPEGLELHFDSGERVFIYVSADNKPADFTILNFIVDDIEKAVDELVSKAVKMEHYDMP